MYQQQLSNCLTVQSIVQLCFKTYAAVHVHVSCIIDNCFFLVEDFFFLPKLIFPRPEMERNGTTMPRDSRPHQTGDMDKDGNWKEIIERKYTPEDDFSRFAKTWRSRHTIEEVEEEHPSGFFTESGAFVDSPAAVPIHRESKFYENEDGLSISGFKACKNVKKRKK